MSASITSGTYPRASARPGAVWRSWGNKLLNTLSEMGTRRAAPYLSMLSVQYQHSNPEVAEQLRSAAREAYANKR